MRTSHSIVVSVIIPCYNHGEYLSSALESIVRCKSVPIEIIVVNDGSTDIKTLELLKEIETKGIKVIHQKNSGPSSAKNNAVKNSSGKYILPVDADNSIEEGFIEKTTKILDENSDIDVVYTDAKIFGDLNFLSTNLEFNIQKLLLSNYIDNCALIRKSSFNSVGGFDEKIWVTEDWELWLRLIKNGNKFYYLKEALFNYRYKHVSLMRGDYNRTRETRKYIELKHPDLLDSKSLDNYFFTKFSISPFSFTLKLFVRKYFKRLYQVFLDKGIIKEFAP